MLKYLEINLNTWADVEILDITAFNVFATEQLFKSAQTKEEMSDIGFFFKLLKICIIRELWPKTTIKAILELSSFWKKLVPAPILDDNRSKVFNRDQWFAILSKHNQI